MTKKRMIKLLMGRVKLSRDSARILSKCKADGVTNNDLYRILEYRISQIMGDDFSVIHVRRTSHPIEID